MFGIFKNLECFLEFLLNKISSIFIIRLSLVEKIDFYQKSFQYIENVELHLKNETYSARISEYVCFFVISLQRNLLYT